MRSRFWLLVFVSLATLNLMGCRELSTTRTYMVQLTDGERWDEHTPRSIDLLVEHGKERYDMGVFLRHDHRLDRMSVRLNLMLHRSGMPVWQDTIELTLAEKPRHWLHARPAMQEVELYLPKPLEIEYTGRYTLEIRPLHDTPTEGINTIGITLTPIERPQPTSRPSLG